MRLSAKEWFLFIAIAILSLLLWFEFSYSQFSFIELSVGKEKAQATAERFLARRGINPKEYLKSVVFISEDWADTFLQKTIGVQAQERFSRENNYELFAWKVRFFKEFQKEEYVFEISPRSGKILSFDHKIEDIAPRPTLDKQIAKAKVQAFLKHLYGLNLAEYAFHEEKIKRYEKRTDYNFSWEKKKVYIPWKIKQGGAKLLCGATISGDEIRIFYRNKLDIPENFYRYIERELILGEYLSTFSYILFLTLVILSVVLVVRRRQTVTLKIAKKWYVYLAIFLLSVNLAYIFNNLQLVLNAYVTSASLASFIGLYLLQATVHIMLLSVMFTIPGIVGESLQEEVFAENRGNSFLHFIKSSFANRSFSRAIILGYLLFFIMLGLQATIFNFGQKYLGVWKHWIKLTQFSSASLPLLSAFVIGLTASLNEEIIFRLFGISWLKKYFRSTILAIILSSGIWGLGHTQYAIFPIWFRAIEVSIIGFFYGFVFIRYGIIPLLVAHYLFDVFWGAAAYIFGYSLPSLFLGSVLILVLPLLFALFFYLANKEEKEREIPLLLDANQEYNLNILVDFITHKKAQGLSPEMIRQELISHGWDFNLVESAIAQAFKTN